MEKNTVCELCGKPVEYDPGVILCEACEKDLNKEPEWVPELREEMRINLDIARQEILPPKLTTRRMIAFLIDGLLMATICLLLGGGFWWLIAIGYLLVRDALIGGRSIGKFVVGLSVMDYDGNTCTLTKSIVRNLLLLVPGVIIEFLVMAYSERGWRLGDRLAKTQVFALRPPAIMGASFLVLALSLLVLGLTLEWQPPELPNFLAGKSFSMEAIRKQGTPLEERKIESQSRDSLAGSERHIIHFRDRKTIAVEKYWEAGDEIKFQRLGIIVAIQRNKVALIENVADGTKKQYNPFFTKP